MPNDSDLSCQSELDSPELEPPSVVELELEPDDDDEPESLPEWETLDKLSGSASSSTGSGSEGTSAFMTCDPIFKPKIEQRVNYVFAFCAWQRWDRGAEIHQQRALGHGSLDNKGDGAHMEQYVHSVWHAPKAPKVFFPRLKNVPKTQVFGCT